MLAQQVFLLSQPSPRPPKSHHSESEILVCLWSRGQGFQLMRPGAPPASPVLGLQMYGTIPLFVCLLIWGVEIKLRSSCSPDKSFIDRVIFPAAERFSFWREVHELGAKAVAEV